MLKIVLIPPGSTDYDQQRRIQGTLDVPLNEKGIAEVDQLIEGLRDLHLDVVYTPKCEPALATAEAIAGAFDIKVKKLDRMQNLNHGLWQGMLIEEVRLKQPKVYRQWQENPDTIRPPEGEMLAEAETRVLACVNRLLKRHKEGAVGLVVPEPMASLVRHCLDRGELGDLWQATNEPLRWEVLEITPEALASSG